MKKEVKRIEVKTERDLIQFISNDGLVFNDEMQCREYEGSAIGKIMEKIHEIAIFTVWQSELLINGSDNFQSFILKNDKKSTQLILQLTTILHQYENSEKVMEKIHEITDEHIIIHVSEDRDWMLISRFSLESLINNLDNLKNQSTPNSK